MKIYDVEGFPNPARVRIALAEKGATDKVEFVSVDVMAGEHRSDAFKAKNPDAVVPCFELADGSHISQCSAVQCSAVQCDYRIPRLPFRRAIPYG